jgi:hypothetical protein
MTDNDISLIKQMITSGKYRAVYDLMPEYNLNKSKAIIDSMGEKWCCHPSNRVKRLEVPLPILNEPKIKVLSRKK